MKANSISKYYYHDYIIFGSLLLVVSATFAMLFLNFIPTLAVKIISFILAVGSTLTILIYFYILYKKQLWVIPKSWMNASRRPKFYFMFLIPCFLILILWINFITYIPLVHTLCFGQTQTVDLKATAAQSHGFKGGTHYYLKTPYRGVPIFRISYDEYQNYVNHPLIIKITMTEGALGTYIRKIHSIQRLEIPPQ
jgi:hypothetical protein